MVKKKHWFRALLLLISLSLVAWGAIFYVSHSAHKKHQLGLELFERDRLLDQVSLLSLTDNKKVAFEAILEIRKKSVDDGYTLAELTPGSGKKEAGLEWNLIAGQDLEVSLKDEILLNFSGQDSLVGVKKLEVPAGDKDSGEERSVLLAFQQSRYSSVRNYLLLIQSAQSPSQDFLGSSFGQIFLKTGSGVAFLLALILSIHTFIEGKRRTVSLPRPPLPTRKSEPNVKH